MTLKVIRSNELPWADALKRGKFEQRRMGLGTGKLSAGLWELAPGKRFLLKKDAQPDSFDGEPDAS